MSVAYLGQVRRRREHTQSAIVDKRELALERLVELARRVVVRPNGLPVEAHRDDVARKAYLHPGPAPAPQVIGNLPRTQSADHREHQRASRPQQAGAATRYIGEVRHAVQRAQIGICAVKGALTLESVELVRAD